MNQSFEELFKKSIKEVVTNPGDIILGEVIAITPKFIVVNSGLKSESVIPIEQFKDNEGNLEVKIGDKIDVSLETLEDGFGETVLSREKAKKVSEWKELEKIYEQGTN